MFQGYMPFLFLRGRGMTRLFMDDAQGSGYRAPATYQAGGPAGGRHHAATWTQPNTGVHGAGFQKSGALKQTPKQ